MRRVVSPENFGALHDRKLPVATRATQSFTLLQNVSALATIYAMASQGEESFDRELVELMAFITRNSVEMWPVLDEFIPTLTPEQREARAGALDMVRSGSAQILGGAITSFGETNVYRPAELVRFAKLLDDTFPLLLQRLSAESAAELLLQLRNAATNAKDKDVAAALRQLLESAEAGDRKARITRLGTIDIHYVEDGASDASVVQSPEPPVKAVVDLRERALPLLVDCLTDRTPAKALATTSTGGVRARTNAPLGYVCLDVLMSITNGKDVHVQDCADDGLGACIHEPYYFRPDVYSSGDEEEAAKRVRAVQAAWREALKKGVVSFVYPPWWKTDVQ
jgi:hypothetical protein